MTSSLKTFFFMRESRKKLALRLKDENIDYIYSSDLKRACDTTKKIGEFHKNIEIYFSEDLRERNLWEFQGKKKSDFGWEAKEFKASDLQPQEGESLKELKDRASKFIQKIDKKYWDKNLTILFVWHNAINKALIATLLKKEIQQIENLQNTSINIFEKWDNWLFKMKLFNCIRHLEK